MHHMQRKASAWQRLITRLHQAELAASGEQFYLREFEAHSIIVAVAEARDDRPVPASLNDDAEFDYEGEDNAESS